MKVTFLGAAHEVTGSCTLLEVNNKKILIDCGMEQGKDIYENCSLPVMPADIDALLLTHAHMDHSGKIPYLVANGYNSPIFATEATMRLCEIMLKDSAFIQESEAEWRNRKAKRNGGETYTPLYTVKDAQSSINLFVPKKYGESFTLFDGIKVKFNDAGHLLGSSSILIEAEENGKSTSILFSGDLGNINRPLIRDPQKCENADYIVIESTYGDRLHGERPDYVAQLTKIIKTTFERGGNVVIPSFAIGRTQELLYLIRTIKDKKLIKGDFPVYVDSPLAIEATGIYSDGMNGFYDDEALDLLKKGIDPIRFSGLKLAVTSEESKLINSDTTPKIIISASGMCEAGRIRHHLKHNLWRKESTVLFVGYQAEGTLGAVLVGGAQEVTLFGEKVKVQAKIETMHGISGHADRDMLVSWLKDVNPKRVFVNHGNDTVCDGFAKKISETLHLNAYAPYSGDAFNLVENKQIAYGEIRKISNTGKQAKEKKKGDNTVYLKLVAAGRRLTSIIDKSGKLANSEIIKFTDRINALCDRYEK